MGGAVVGADVQGNTREPGLEKPMAGQEAELPDENAQRNWQGEENQPPIVDKQGGNITPSALNHGTPELGNAWDYEGDGARSHVLHPKGGKAGGGRGGSGASMQSAVAA